MPPEDGGPPRGELVRDLSLMLLYLTSWRERRHDHGLHAWRGMDWAALDALREQDLVRYRNHHKSVDFTLEGVRVARALLEAHGYHRALGEMADRGLDLDEA